MQPREVLVPPSEILDYLLVDQGVDRIEAKAILQHALALVLQL